MRFTRVAGMRTCELCKYVRVARLFCFYFTREDLQTRYCKRVRATERCERCLCYSIVSFRCIAANYGTCARVRIRLLYPCTNVWICVLCNSKQTDWFRNPSKYLHRSGDWRIDRSGRPAVCSFYTRGRILQFHIVSHAFPSRRLNTIPLRVIMGATRALILGVLKPLKTKKMVFNCSYYIRYIDISITITMDLKKK
jgi:hypothetical protein